MACCARPFMLPIMLIVMNSCVTCLIRSLRLIGSLGLLRVTLNLTPQENWLVDVLVASGAVCSLPSGLSSTRWEGRRVLDYAVTNLPGVSSSLLEAKFSDHKGLLFALGVAQVDRARTIEAVPCNVFLAKDPCQAVAWHNLVRHAWSQFPFSRYCAAELCGQGLEVDVIWQIFEQHCESVLSHAANLAASSGIVLVRVRRSCRPKGSAVVFRTRHASSSSTLLGLY